MSTIDIHVLPQVGPGIPRGSRFAAWLFLAVSDALQRLFSAPAPAAPPASDPAQEARAVRELAQQYQHADPRFAADLLAAADRHERLHGTD